MTTVGFFVSPRFVQHCNHQNNYTKRRCRQTRHFSPVSRIHGVAPWLARNNSRPYSGHMLVDEYEGANQAQAQAQAQSPSHPRAWRLESPNEKRQPHVSTSSSDIFPIKRASFIIHLFIFSLSINSYMYLQTHYCSQRWVLHWKSLPERVMTGRSCTVSFELPLLHVLQPQEPALETEGWSAKG